MTNEEEKVHLFYSRGAARAFSENSGRKGQSLADLLEEIASSVGVGIVSEQERLIALLRSGIQIDDLLDVEHLLSFLRITGKGEKLHKIKAEDTSEKRIERYSEAIVNYYKLISEQGKSEPEDFYEFRNLFPVRDNTFSNYIAHLHSSLKPYNDIPLNKEITFKKKPKTLKKQFPDYWTEYRWIARDAVLKKGRTCIIVPDDFTLINVSKELEIFGIFPTSLSKFPLILLNDSPLTFITSALRAIIEDYSFEAVISLIQNPHCDIDASKIKNVKNLCNDKNITNGLNDWKSLFRDLKIGSHIIFDLEKLNFEIQHFRGLGGLIELTKKYLGNYGKPVINILTLLRESFSEYSDDPSIIATDIDSLREVPKGTLNGDSNYYVSKPIDAIGLEFENIYLMSLDVSSSYRAFSEESRDLLSKIGLENYYETFMGEIYEYLLKSGKSVVLTYSSLDSEFSYTESSPTYDDVDGKIEYIPRKEVFVPSKTIMDWEIQIERPTKDRYELAQELVRKRLDYPLSPTFIENYLGCHFKAFVNGLLKIDKIDPPGEFLDPRTTGSLTHKILEHYYSATESPEEFGKLAENFINDEIRLEKFDSKRMALEFYKDRYISSGRLQRFFRMEASRALELGRKTLYKEFKFPKDRNEKFYYEFNNTKVGLIGFVDRVDEENDGEMCVIDYKSSLSHYPKNDLCDKNEGKVQLYFYKYAVESILQKKVKAAAYVSFKDISGGLNTAGFYQEIENEEAQTRKCANIVNPSLEEFISGDFDPIVKKGGSLWKCEHTLYCPLLSVCRVQERRW